MAAQNKPAGVPPVHPGRALESMRNSSFDTFSAIGELLDNAVEAKSTEIFVLLDQHDENAGKRGRPKIRTRFLAVGDNGHGMDASTLHRCLQLGYSTRYNDRKGIGRFGVGMTLGSINQCRHIEVYTREKGADWLFAELDLDAVEKAGDSAAIAAPIKKSPPDEFAKLTGKASGTVVLWKRIDRMHDNSMDDLTHWIGRTYRKFLASQILSDQPDSPPKLVRNPHQVKISISKTGEKANQIPAFDPLYALPNAPGDPRAQLAETISIPCEIDDQQVQASGGGRTAQIFIRLSLLPKELRPNRGWGGTTEAKRRYIHENTGFSILRNGREVFYGPWIGVLELGDEAKAGRLFDRYWGMEIDFPATLDNQFQVRNIKTGAKPLASLREVIEKAVGATIAAYRKEIQAHWDEVEAEADKAKPEPARKHSTAESIAAATKPKPVKATPEQTQQLVEKLVPDITKLKGEEGERAVTEWIRSVKESFKIIESTAAHRNGPFLDISPQGGKVFVLYTMKHKFFQLWSYYYSELSNAALKNEPDTEAVIDHAKALRDLLDVLFMAYADAYNDSIGNDQEHAEPVLEYLMQRWSATLGKWTSDLASR